MWYVCVPTFHRNPPYPPSFHIESYLPEYTVSYPNSHTWKILKSHIPMFGLRRWKGFGVSHKIVLRYVYFGFLYYHLQSQYFTFNSAAVPLIVRTVLFRFEPRIMTLKDLLYSQLIPVRILSRQPSCYQCLHRQVFTSAQRTLNYRPPILPILSQSISVSFLCVYKILKFVLLPALVDLSSMSLEAEEILKRALKMV
jgi:hypothetical protein